MPLLIIEAFLMEKFVCPICGNEDLIKTGIKNGVRYCRACISFGVKEEKITKNVFGKKKAPIFLSYELSKEQKEISNKLIENYNNKINSLVYAVCGAGKTEIVLNIISKVIESGGNVAFAIPRKDVVIEIGERFQSIFKENTVVALHGGNTQEKFGDIICLTTHQLYRYEKYFDLIIIDEIDAFPYKDNSVLESFFKSALRGNYIQMSATPSEEVLKIFSQEGYAILKLLTRFHRHPLPVPKIIKGNDVVLFVRLYLLLKRFKKEKKPVFVFCPSIAICEKYGSIFSMLISSVNYVHSKREDRLNMVKDFKKKKIDILFTTSILERGVTVSNLQVIVIKADSRVFTSYALIQIAGRVGRKKDCPTGEVYFMCKEENDEIRKSIREIVDANKSLC